MARLGGPQLTVQRHPGLALGALALLLAACGSSSSGAGDSEVGGSVRIGPRAELASNACVAFAPTGADRQLTVFVDPGHGGRDPGATATTADGALLEEKTFTLAVALKLTKILRLDGYEVVLSRATDSPVARLRSGSLSAGLYTADGIRRDLQARVDCANAAHARLLTAIHFDGFDDPSVGGAVTTYDPNRPFWRHSRRFAQLVQHSLLNVLARHGWNVYNRGVIADTHLATPALSAQGAAYGHLLVLGPEKPGWLDRASNMPGALTEPLFLTDPAEAGVAQSATGQQAMAQALAQAINGYFSTSHES